MLQNLEKNRIFYLSIRNISRLIVKLASHNKVVHTLTPKSFFETLGR